MSSHYTKQAFILFIISLLFAGFIWLFNANTSENVLGNRVFENADNNISSIIFESERLSVTLDKSDNMWRIRQADSYFANHALANALVKFINYAKIYRRVEMTEEEIKKYFSDNITIKIADMNNQPLGKIILSSRKDAPKTAYAQIEGKEGIFKIEEDIVFPTQFMFWLQQPLLNLYPAAIKSLRIDDETVTRQRGSKYFYREDKSPYSLSGIEKTLNNLEFETVISAQNFDEALYPLVKKYTITTFDGMEIELNLFRKEQEIWVQQKISQTTLSTPAISDYIKRNDFLYKYWYFKLSPTTGNILMQEKI